MNPQTDAGNISEESANRIGAVEAPTVSFASAEALESSPTFKAMEGRLREGARIASINECRSLHHLETELGSELEACGRTHRLNGLMIASPDGLVIAKSAKLEQELVVAAIAALCEGVCTRIRGEALLASVDEITLRSRNGGRLTIRTFTAMEQTFLLVIRSRHAVPMWMSDEIIARCGRLLNGFHAPLVRDGEAEAPQKGGLSQAIRRLLAPFSTSTLLD